MRKERNQIPQSEQVKGIVESARGMASRQGSGIIVL